MSDGDAGWLGEWLPEILRSCGFERSTSFRWTEKAGVRSIHIDLLATPDSDPAELPTPMTIAQGGDLAVLRPRRIRLSPTLEVAIPGPRGFLALKVAASRYGETGCDLAGP